MSYIQQLSSENWVKGIAMPVAWLKYKPSDLTLTHSIDFRYIDDDASGLGAVECALLQTRAGHIFGLIRYVQAPDKDYTAILVDEKLSDASALFTEIMLELELQSTDLRLIDKRYCQLPPCKLIRQDDYGTQIVVGEFNCYADAYFAKTKLEYGGHKQCYSIEVAELPVDERSEL